MLGRGAALRNSLCAVGAPLRHPQRVRARCAACYAAAPAPRPALLGTARGDLKSARAIAALGLGIDFLSLWERACPREGGGVRQATSKTIAACALSSTRSNAFTPQRRPIKRKPLSKITRPFFPVRAGWAGRAFDRLTARPLPSGPQPYRCISFGRRLTALSRRLRRHEPALKDRCRAGGRWAYSPAAALRAAALSVFSHVNSGSSRPKWP
jgi:hypothetical protein